MLLKFVSKWIQPTSKWYAPSHVPKLNSDGCSKGNPGDSAGGGFLRDTNGKAIFSYACNFGVLTTLQAEVKAPFKGLQLCIAKDSIRFT